MKTITIDRNTWARAGAEKGPSALLNEQGNMCCLGFACEQLGVPRPELAGKDVPSDLLHLIHLIPEELRYNKGIDEALSANDDHELSPAMREARIEAAFTKMGLKAVFVGLPDTLSDLLRVAVQDAIAVSKMPGYELDMYDWIQTRNDGVCYVCMAGACIVRELEKPEKTYNGEIFPSQYKTKDETKLLAINSLRPGHIFSASKLLNVELPDEVINRVRAIFRTYNHKYKAGRFPWKAYQKVSRYLREAGY